MSRSLIPGLIVLCLGGCADGDAVDALPWCEGPVAQVYDPLYDPDLAVFPDDLHTRPDPTSPTGLRLDVTATTLPWVDTLPDLVANVVEGLTVPSGFARQGAVLMRFTGDVGTLPSGVQASTAADSPLRLVDLSTEPPTPVPFEVRMFDEGRQMHVQPLRPLASGAEHALVLTTGHAAAEGTCVSPSPTLRALLTWASPDPAFDAVAPRYAALADRLGLHPTEVSAATVFTTHADAEVLAAVADDVADRTYTWVGPRSCEPDGPALRCQGAVEVQDYRDDLAIRSPEPTTTYTLPVDVWLPTDAGPGPHPTVLYGHGMNGRRSEGGTIADRLAPLGIAVVSTDALEHGEHPTANASLDLAGASFLGLDLDAVSIDGLALRGNFNQTVVDRLQVLRLLRQEPDVDGDGTPDIDADQLGYMGISLGGLLAPGILAYDDGVQLGAMPVGGGHLTVFATDTAITAFLVPLFENLMGGEAPFQAFLTVLQSVADPADPAVLASHVLDDRLVGDPDHRPHLLLPVAMQDDIVPPATGRALARGFGLPHMAPVVEPVPLLPLAGPGPLVGNLDGTTAAFFQLDRVMDDGELDPALHPNAPLSEEGELQWVHFFDTWMTDGTPEILDPYEALGTPTLP